MRRRHPENVDVFWEESQDAMSITRCVLGLERNDARVCLMVGEPVVPPVGEIPWVGKCDVGEGGLREP